MRIAKAKQSMDDQELNVKLADLAHCYTQLLTKELGERLVSVALFGSVAGARQMNARTLTCSW
jgi:hypothetical protein